MSALVTTTTPVAYRRAIGERYELRHGRYQDVLRDETCDFLFGDCPYSERTHKGYRSGSKANDAKGIAYKYFSAADVSDFVQSWSPRTRGWMGVLSDDELSLTWKRAFEAAGRLTFPMIPCVIRGSGCRLMGDGPSSVTVFLVVARPRTAKFAKWGTLQGHYDCVVSDDAKEGRGKPLDLIRAILRDYSRPGDKVIDPVMGFATTGRAALPMGRSFLGADVDLDAVLKAEQDMSQCQVVDLFDPVRAVQVPLFAPPTPLAIEGPKKAPRRKKEAANV